MAAPVTDHRRFSLVKGECVRETGMEAPILSVLSGYHVQKILGQGSEGTVYLAEDTRGSKKLILKVFHEPKTSDWLPGLIPYADKISANDAGLPVISLIFDRDRIAGLVYPFVQLSSIHWRIMNLFENVAQSLVGSYCRKQYYLMSKHGLALHDPVLSNFMVDKGGQWHYLDIGGSICLLNQPWVLQHGRIAYGFASMLLSIHHRIPHHLIFPVDYYSYDDSCVYCMNECLDDIAAQHEWVNVILSEIRSQKSSIFHNPDFYRRLGERFPSRVPRPSLILPVSNALSWMGKMRRELRRITRLKKL